MEGNVMDKNKVLELLTQDKYYSVDDLRYNQKVGVMFSKEQFSEFLSIKDELADEKNEIVDVLPLKTFNSKYCFFVYSKYLDALFEEYLRIQGSDYQTTHKLLFARNLDDIMTSRLFSEIEGSLNIENIPTTNKRIKEIYQKKELVDNNDIIVRNMLDAIMFITEEKPAFTKANLLKLYNILSKDSLPEDKQLKAGAYYRHDKVYIGAYEGAPVEAIDQCMDSLFSFVSNEDNVKQYNILLPQICHYYLLYVHPYFDFNGRTARMVSFWLNYVNNMFIAPFFVSEAINDSKSNYYRAIENTRNTNNDLTYFLGYIFETSIKYSFIYKNLEEIKNELSKTGDSLTNTEWNYVKKILVHNSENYFKYKEFLTYINATMTKPGALKILNNLTDYGILEKAKNKKGEIIYKLNQDLVIYKYNG
jgi:Fic family protein